MSSIYTPTPAELVTTSLPDDGDLRDAVKVGVPFQDCADAIKKLQDEQNRPTRIRLPMNSEGVYTTSGSTLRTTARDSNAGWFMLPRQKVAFYFDFQVAPGQLTIDDICFVVKYEGTAGGAMGVRTKAYVHYQETDTGTPQLIDDPDGAETTPTLGDIETIVANALEPYDPTAERNWMVSVEAPTGANAVAIQLLAVYALVTWS